MSGNFDGGHSTDAFASRQWLGFVEYAVTHRCYDTLRAARKMLVDYYASGKPEFFGFASDWIDEHTRLYGSLTVMRNAFHARDNFGVKCEVIQLSCITGAGNSPRYLSSTNDVINLNHTDLALKTGF